MFILGSFLTLCVHSHILNAAPALNDSMLSHSVLLKFSNVNLNEWHAGGKDSILQNVVANLTTEYCQSNPEKCLGSNSTSPRFEKGNVKTVMNYPKNKGTDLETLIYVEIPNSSTSSKIPGGTLKTIAANGNLKINSEVGYNLVSIISAQTLAHSDEQGVNNDLNKVMIPVAFALLLAIALICWLLHRGRKKQQARAERRRYNALHNHSKNAASLREKGGAMVNTADKVPSAQVQPERRPTPDQLDNPENEDDEANNNIRRHKKKRSLPKRQPIRKASVDESDDVTYDEDPDELEKPKKKGRRRKGRRSYDLNQDYETQAAKELASSQVSSEGTNRDFQVNEGYRQDSGKGESDPARNSNADSAVELNSSVASSANQSRARTLPPIPKTSEQEIV